MPNCLVTGGAGFIGSHLVEALVAGGHAVAVLDNFDTGKRENLAAVADRLRIIEGSVTDPAAVRQALRGQQWVFHLAALASVQKSVEDPPTSHEVCATGTLHVLNAARQEGVRRVVFAASSSCYGNLSEGARREDDPVSPLSPYAAAKLAGEAYCQSFTSTYGLETVRLRFFNVFGPRQDTKNPYSGVIALFCAAMRAGREPTIYGDGLQSRDFVPVADAVQALLKAAEAPSASGRVYNIGTGKSTNLLQLVETLNFLLGSRLRAKHGPPRPGDVRHSLADISLARQELGYAPTIPFEEGIRRMLSG